ncbi:MAG: mechanosensitive ion channel family protein [Deltaproteobacteria bacterium]|nr:MAG: mechanosensitive ion channel family protein [Deltaproteobacteria bacterium]
MDEQTLIFLLDQAREWGIKIGGVLIALFVAWVIAGWLSSRVRKTLEGRKFDATLTRFFSKIVRYAILIFAGLGCLGVFGIETTSFAAVLAAAGLAVGLAFQGTLSNFASGIMLLVFRPFKVDDFVDAGGVTGTVEEIELFTTEIKTPDNKRVIVPNSAIFGSTITNVTHYPTRRVGIDVGVDYGASTEETRKVLETVPGKIEGVLSDPAPQIFLKSLGASSVDWVVRVWCKTEDYWDVHQRTISATKLTLDEAKLGIPYPQMDVHLDAEAVDALRHKG